MIKSVSVPGSWLSISVKSDMLEVVIIDLGIYTNLYMIA